MVFFKIRQKKGLWIARSKRLKYFVKLMSKNSISGRVRVPILNTVVPGSEKNSWTEFLEGFRIRIGSGFSEVSGSGCGLCAGLTLRRAGTCGPDPRPCPPSACSGTPRWTSPGASQSTPGTHIKKTWPSNLDMSIYVPVSQIRIR